MMLNHKKEDFLKQSLLSLQVTFEQIQQDESASKPHRDTIDQIEKALSEDATLNKINYIEQSLVPLLFGELLNSTLKRNLVQISMFDSDLQKHYQVEAEEALTDRQKQTLLSKLIEDLQWHKQQLIVKQETIYKVWAKAGYGFIFSFFLFFLPALIPGLGEALLSAGKGAGRALNIYTALSSGALGAAFTMIISVRKRIANASTEGLFIMQSHTFVASRIITGIGGGLILYYFLQSGILEGGIFPRFVSVAGHYGPVLIADGDKQFSLLVIWCFIAGFSETMIPSMILKTEQQLVGK